MANQDEKVVVPISNFSRELLESMHKQIAAKKPKSKDANKSA